MSTKTFVNPENEAVMLWSMHLRARANLPAFFVSHQFSQHNPFSTYRELCWWGTHASLYDKSQTYSVEGTNADLRHYLARLGRRSRCISGCFEALRRAVDLFVRFYNARQLRERNCPRYPAPLATMT
jgi:hypothetical protein